jgi:hypothetical protein
MADGGGSATGVGRRLVAAEDEWHAILRHHYRRHPPPQDWGAESWGDSEWSDKIDRILASYRKKSNRATAAAVPGSASPSRVVSAAASIERSLLTSGNDEADDDGAGGGGRRRRWAAAAVGGGGGQCSWQQMLVAAFQQQKGVDPEAEFRAHRRELVARAVLAAGRSSPDLVNGRDSSRGGAKVAEAAEAAAVAPTHEQVVAAVRQEDKQHALSPKLPAVSKESGPRALEEVGASDEVPSPADNNMEQYDAAAPEPESELRPGMPEPLSTDDDDDDDDDGDDTGSTVVTSLERLSSSSAAPDRGCTVPSQSSQSHLGPCDLEPEPEQPPQSPPGAVGSPLAPGDDVEAAQRAAEHQRLARIAACEDAQQHLAAAAAAAPAYLSSPAAAAAAAHLVVEVVGHCDRCERQIRAQQWDTALDACVAAEAVCTSIVVLALQEDSGHSALGGLRARIAELHQQATSGAEAAAATRQRAEAAAALLAAGHLDSAVAEYEQALQLSPNDNETVAGMRTAVREAFSIFVSPVLTEIYLCHARSCHEIEDGNAPGRMKP